MALFFYQFKITDIRCVALAIGILLFCVALPSLADEPAELGEIHVAGETKAESIEAPSSFVTVIRPERENTTFESVADLIATSPGVTERSLGGMGQFSTVSIRGSSPEQVSVFLDGIKLNTASGGAFDFSTIPIDIIDRIEVIRGGGTAQFGADAIGGVINIVTKSARKGRRIEAFAGGGSFTTFKLGSTYSEQFKRDSLTVSWSHFQSKGDYTFKTNSVRLSGGPAVGGGQTFTRIHNGFLSESLLTNWKHKFSDQISLNFLNDFFFTDRQVPGTEEETTLLYPTNPLAAKDRIFRNTTGQNLNIDPFFTKPLSFTWGATNNLNVDIFKDATPAIGNPINVKTTNDSVGSFLRWLAFLDHGKVNQTITLRYDYLYDYLTDSSPLTNAILTGTKTRHTNSIFIQDEVAFFDDKLIILPVFRYEDASDFPDDISYKGGVKIQPIKWVSLKANFERSFRYPSFNELYFPDQGYIRGNPDLKKEQAWNLDAGIDVKTKYVGAEIAYFQNWIDNSILFVPISATTIEPVNTFQVSTKGLEAAISIDPIKYFHLDANYTYLDAHYTSNNNQLPGRPKHEFNARLELAYDWKKNIGATLFSNFNYKSQVPLNQANSVFLAARSKIDLGLNFRFLKYYYLTFQAKNITNVQIYDARGFPLPRRSFFATLGGKWS